MKTKDFVLVAILGIVYFVFYVLIKVATNTFTGIFTSIVSIPLTALLTSIIPLLLVRKCSKFGVLSIYTIIWVAMIGVMKPIIPWIVVVVVFAFIADLIVYYSQYTKLWLVGLSFGIMAVGQSVGEAITILLFWGWYGETFTDNMGKEWIQSFLVLFQGISLVIFLVLPLVAGFVGTFLAEKIYNKHFGKTLGQQDTATQ